MSDMGLIRERRSADRVAGSATIENRGRGRRLGTRLALVAGSLLIGLLLAEGAVRLVELITGASFAIHLEARFEMAGLFQPHPYVGYVLRPGSKSPAGAAGQFSVNGMGFRGAAIKPMKPPRTFRVACLGGSTTYGSVSNDDDHTWPAQLQVALNAALPENGYYKRIEVINAGVSSYTSLESFVNFKMRVMPLEPDLVILYHGINDARVMGTRGFLPDYSHVRSPWVMPLPSRMDILFGWSHLYGLIRGPGAVTTLDDVISKPFIAERVTGDEIVPGLATWRRTLTELTSVARGNGVAVILTTFAYTRQYGTRTKWMAPAFKIVDAMNEITKQRARALGTLFADLSDAVGTRKDYYIDPVHLSDAGNHRIAEELSGVITSSGLLSRKRR